jgi:hypothetical protein
MGIRTSSNRPTIAQGTPPRGRPVMAAFGIALSVAGVVALILAAQGVLPLGLPQIPRLSAPGLPGTSSSAGSTTTAAGAPSGTAPPAFTAYRDSQHRFALYISNTWQSTTATITVNGESAPLVAFAPISSTVPNWNIAFLATPLPDGLGYIQAIQGLLQQDGATNIQPVQGPNSIVVGQYTWSQVDLTAQLHNGLQAHITAFTRTTGSGGGILILEDAASFSFATTDSQDFTPMLASLTLAHP